LNNNYSTYSRNPKLAEDQTHPVLNERVHTIVADVMAGELICFSTEKLKIVLSITLFVYQIYHLGPEHCQTAVGEMDSNHESPKSCL